MSAQMSPRIQVFAHQNGEVSAQVYTRLNKFKGENGKVSILVHYVLSFCTPILRSEHTMYTRFQVLSVKMEKWVHKCTSSFGFFHVKMGKWVCKNGEWSHIYTGFLIFSCENEEVSEHVQWIPSFGCVNGKVIPQKWRSECTSVLLCFSFFMSKWISE